MRKSPRFSNDTVNGSTPLGAGQHKIRLRSQAKNRTQDQESQSLPPMWQPQSDEAASVEGSSPPHFPIPKVDGVSLDKFPHPTTHRDAAKEMMIQILW